jgi:ELP3 family radical SAM enzyme/protein acetyltransferase
VQSFSCKHNCYYCPDEPGLPRSYLSEEPGVARGKRHGWDAVDQFYARAWTYVMNGHPIDKVELLVLGGTWSEYPHGYQRGFLRDIYWAANTFFDELPKRPAVSIEEEQRINETARVRIIGLTLETRPDAIDDAELVRMRGYGCTRVQLGIQHTDDTILKKINRGCTTADSMYAIAALKDAGFKVDLHLMPDLPGSTPENDMSMFRRVLFDPDLQADQWKIYPCEVVPWTVIERWFKAGTYVPYTHEQLMALLIDAKQLVHPWIRLNRVIRDIPNQYIMGGNQVTNLRQVLEKELHRTGKHCACIRCREVRDGDVSSAAAVLVEREFVSSRGVEMFLSYESPDRRTIHAFLRLRLSATAGARGNGEYIHREGAGRRGRRGKGRKKGPGKGRERVAGRGRNEGEQGEMEDGEEGGQARWEDEEEVVANEMEELAFSSPSLLASPLFPELHGAAIVRELHVYGQMRRVGDRDGKGKRRGKKKGDKTQHVGFGRRLMHRAEVRVHVFEDAHGCGVVSSVVCVCVLFV